MKFVKSALLALGLLVLAQATASAQAPATSTPAATSTWNGLGGGPPAPSPRGLVIIGAAMGIGGLTRSAVESMARQPETPRVTSRRR